MPFGDNSSMGSYYSKTLKALNPEPYSGNLTLETEDDPDDPCQVLT